MQYILQCSLVSHKFQSILRRRIKQQCVFLFLLPCKPLRATEEVHCTEGEEFFIFWRTARSLGFPKASESRLGKQPRRSFEVGEVGAHELLQTALSVAVNVITLIQPTPEECVSPGVHARCTGCTRPPTRQIDRQYRSRGYLG